MHSALSIVCLVTISVGITQFSAAASAIDKDGFIIDSECKNDADCAIKVDKFPKLTLQCVDGKCKCSYQGEVVPDFLYLEPENNQCLMSKYGGCGKGLKQPDLEVGCSGGFQCLIDQRCRDPANPNKVHDDVFSFKTDTKTTKCSFSSKLELKLEEKACVCKVKSPKKRVWKMLSYEEGKSCSVTKFGPCGVNTELEIEIGCHGAGIKCVGGICTDPTHPKSVEGEPCSDTEHCKDGIICNLNTQKCIPRHSKKNGEACSVTEHCLEGLICNSNFEKCIAQNSMKNGEVCTVVDGKDECKKGYVCTTKRFAWDKDKTAAMNKPKCWYKHFVDADPEGVCKEKCYYDTVCNVDSKFCVYSITKYVSEGEICSVTTPNIEKKCDGKLKCLPSKEHKKGTLTCQNNSPTSLVVFTIGIFKLNIIIPLILTVVIPIINF